jgi:D-serine deaminase-like pyridoxal phosphate-dependent protein
MTIDDLDTPSLVLDLDLMQVNIVRMATVAREAGVAVRPHAKTHKMPEVGKLQLAAGSPGLTVAKLGEAEVFADSGIDDLFIAYPLWSEAKWERLCRLAQRARVRVAAGADLPIGSRLQIIPNHVCVTINLHDQVNTVREGRLEGVWQVAGRGRVQ